MNERLNSALTTVVLVLLVIALVLLLTGNVGAFR